jgi:crotonobetainyl-CoA:carnitine CoA-transferase CaiB-like acyl-CoA transferase
MSAVAGGTPTRRTPDGFVEQSSDYSENINTISEVVAGPLYLAFGVAAALYRREKTGEGAYLDVASSDAGLAAAWMSVVTQMNRERIGADETGMARASTGGSNSKYNLYETKDGRPMLAALIEHHFYEHFCKAAGREDLLDENVGYVSKAVAIDWGPPSLRPILADFFRERTTAEWMALAEEYDFVVAPVNGLADLQTDPHLVVREAVIDYEHPTGGTVTVTGNPIKVEGAQYRVRYPAPALGEHTDEFLRGLGYGDTDLERWRGAGVIGG